MTSIPALALLAAIALASTLSGRLLVGALRVRWLLPFEPTRAAASAVLGTAFCIVAFDRLSAAGMPAPRIVVVLALAHVGLAAAVVARGRLRALRPAGRAASWAGLTAAASVVAVFSLLPLLRTNGYDFLNDSYTYCAFSEWLQSHGFGTPADYDASSPVSAIPAQWQRWGFPLGASYALALVEACTGKPSVVLYPVVSAWGLLLGLCGAWVVTRWVLRLGPAWVAGGACVFGLLPNPCYWAHHHGFLSQTYAVAPLLLGIAVMARTAGRPRGSLCPAGLLALLAADLLAVYVPFLPLLAAAALAGVVVRLRHRRPDGSLLRWLALHAATVPLFLLLAGFDLRPALRGLRVLPAVPVGFPISLSPFEGLSFALGTGLLGAKHQLLGPAWPVQWLTTAAAVLLVASGLAQATRRPRSAPFLAVLALLGALAGYYALVARDPWSGETGHSWNVFKAVQWAFPLVFLLQVTGAAHIARQRGRRAAVALALVPLSLAAPHWRWADWLGGRMRNVILEEQPLRELPRLRRGFESQPPGTLVLLGRPASQSPWLAAWTALLAYPRPIVGDWMGSASIPLDENATAQAYAGQLQKIGKPGSVPIRWGIPPWLDAAGVQALGSGFDRLVDLDRPRLVQVPARWTAAWAEAGAPLRFGGSVTDRVRFVFYSQRETPADLRIVGDAEASTVTLEVRTFPGAAMRGSLKAAGAETSRATVSGRLPLLAKVDLGTGLTTVVITSSDGSRMDLSDVLVAPRPRAPEPTAAP